MPGVKSTVKGRNEKDADAGRKKPIPHEASLLGRLAKKVLHAVGSSFFLLTFYSSESGAPRELKSRQRFVQVP